MAATDAVAHLADHAERSPVRQDGSRWVWILILPLFLFLGFALSIGPLSISFTALWLPIAAWLGARHGRHGLQVIAIAALPLLTGFSSMSISTPGSVGLYLACLVVGRLAAGGEYRQASLAADSITPRMLAFLFLAIGCELYWEFSSFPGARFFVATGFSSYLWVLLFVLGLSSAPRRAVIVCLAVSATAGFALPWLGAFTPRLAGFGVGYHIAGPQDLATGIVALVVGRVFRGESMAEPAVTQRQIPGVWLVFLALSLAGSMIEMAVPSFDGRRDVYASFSTAPATAILLFACGLVGGWRGAGIAAVIWLAGCVALPVLALEFMNLTSLRFGPVTIVSAKFIVGVSFAAAPGWTVALLDPVFALFGWQVGRRLAHACAVSRPTKPAAGTQGTIPPQFRFRVIDQIGAALGGLWLIGSMVFGLFLLGRALFSA